MRRLVGIVIGSLLVYVISTVALLYVRRKVTAMVGGRSAGLPVSLPSMADVLDAGHGYWRGPAPNEAHYAELADAGCGLIVDLRAEADRPSVKSAAVAAGLQVMFLPTNNTRPPSRSHVSELCMAQASSGSRVAYVHCEAGEGRTGAILGALAVRNGQKRSAAMADALSVGSLTFSQLFYIGAGARVPLLPTLIDWTIDRPTEALLGFVSRR